MSAANGSKPTTPIASQDIVVLDRVFKHYRVPGSGFGRRRDRVHSVDGVSLSIARGEVMGLVGESGSGKSTLARVIMRLVEVDRGSVVVDSQETANLKRRGLSHLRRTVQLVFQDPHSALDPRMRLGVSLESALSQNRIGAKSERHAKVLAALEEVGLNQSFALKYPRQCSGGQLQRVVIARALLLEPRVLVCDEPTSSLDASVQATILNLLLDLRRSHGLTLVMISHNLKVVKFTCDRVAVMYLGQIVETADREELFDRPAHPYTQALLSAALPENGVIGPDVGALGEPPSPIHPPPGCRFNPRCPLATDRCRSEAPQAQEVIPGHVVSCHNWREALVPITDPHNLTLTRTEH